MKHCLSLSVWVRTNRGAMIPWQLRHRYDPLLALKASEVYAPVDVGVDTRTAESMRASNVSEKTDATSTRRMIRHREDGTIRPSSRCWLTERVSQFGVVTFYVGLRRTTRLAGDEQR
jgi:hypothetical protein